MCEQHLEVGGFCVMCIWSQLGSCLEKSPRQDRDYVEAKLWGAVGS